MRVELVHVVHLLAADIALPRIALAVTALVQEVERLVGELDPAEQTLEVSLAVQRDQVVLRARRSYDPIGGGGHQGGRIGRSVVVAIGGVAAPGSAAPAHSGSGRGGGPGTAVVVAAAVVTRRPIAGPCIYAALQVFPEQ